VTRALVMGVALSLGSCSLFAPRSTPPPPPTNATLFFTADLHGYIEPCGCSLNMRGGLSRVAQVVNSARADGQHVFYFDSGSGLFPAQQVPEASVGQQERKASALAQGLSLMNLTARAPGPLDDARGQAFRQGLGLPELPPATISRVDAGGYPLAVVSAGTLAAAQTLAATARREGAVFVVALLPRSFEASLPGLVDARDVDLVLASQPRDELAAEQNKLLGVTTKLAQVQSKGRSVLRVDLVLREQGRSAWLKGNGERDRELASLDERIELTRAQANDPSLGDEMRALRSAKLDDLVGRRAALASEPVVVPETGNFASARFVPVESSVPKDPRVAEVERDYNQEVGAMNLAWAKEHGQDCPAATPEQPGFVGSTVCGACHPEALAVWQKTKHPRAYEVLVKEGKQYHLDCVTCHVALWQQPAGTCRVDQTAGREEVSCESCHGPGSNHLANPVKQTIARADSKQTCLKCHDHENSPSFEYETYLPRIRGPGHGLPKP
jgi:hypothetical protein